jgi:hypothetical protein
LLPKLKKKIGVKRVTAAAATIDGDFGRMGALRLGARRAGSRPRRRRLRNARWHVIC